MTLDELITALAAADPTLVLPHGFTNPHSYRSYYDELAFEPTTNVPVADMLADARSALGTTMTGWKGGDFTMRGYTDCWLAQEGSAGGETLGPLLLQFMLDAGIRDAARQTTGQTDTELLRPRAERCPEPECTDERQCWRCDYEESQHAALQAAPTCTSAHPVHPIRCILPGRHAVPHTDGAVQWPEHIPVVGQPAEAHDTDEAHPPAIGYAVEIHTDNQWTQASSSYDTMPTARSAERRVQKRQPGKPTRIIREVLTRTVVEDER